MSVEFAAQAAYLVAALLFILALAGLSRHETAKAGNVFGIAGMALALAATTLNRTRPGSGQEMPAPARMITATRSCRRPRAECRPW